uniref:Inositol polyphosphate-related phosphatase domain-containing protein n=1 Tax=Spongospora subterranea TaxID=70186 RepID=A0A0H5R9C1_9EUKA|eukprot:CRZ10371.1 hypothetical protein [Spongospora subterranea]
MSSLKILFAVWNLNGRPISDSKDNLRKWLTPDADGQPDLFVIGMQELPALAVTTLFSTPDTDNLSLQYQSQIEPTIKSIIPPGYGRLICNEFGAMSIDIYIKDNKRHHVKELATRACGVGILGGLGQKGGLSVRMSYMGHSLCILSCHLAANDGARDTRDAQCSELWTNIQYCNESGRPVSVSDHEHVIMMGDLNYRMQAPSNVVVDLIRKGGGMISSKDIAIYDEILNDSGRGPKSKGLTEMPINFPPTFKYIPFSDQLNSQDRVPSYTDRILYRPPKPTGQPSAMKCLLYDSVQSCLCSDHKPVMALFEWNVDDSSSCDHERLPQIWPADPGNRAAQSLTQAASSIIQTSMAQWTYWVGDL